MMVGKPPRFVVTPFTGERMRQLGEGLLGSIQGRLDRAENIFDIPALPLKPNYAKLKARKHPPAIRNLKYSGITRGTLHVMATAENQAILGSRDARANRILFFNKQRDPQWGMSPKDRHGVERQISGMRPIKVERG